MARKEEKDKLVRLTPELRAEYEKTKDERRLARAAKLIGKIQQFRKEDIELAFVARAMAQATLPHSPTNAREYARTNGRVTIRAVTLKEAVGLPFGIYPRLIFTWITTEAVRTKNPELELGDNLSGFMAQLGLVPTGGRWGSITRLREQMNRVLHTALTWTVDGDGTKQMKSVVPIEEASLFWDPHNPAQKDFEASFIRLQDSFFKAITDRPVPLSMEALHVLTHQGRSPLALDTYTWLAHRMSYLSKKTVISWDSLHAQFGAEYGRTRDFKAKFLNRLKLVQRVYPEARVYSCEEPGESGLVLEPSPTPLPRNPRQLNP